jgi:hypothetical protein
MARFEKGNNMGKGRPKGSENKVTKQIKDSLDWVMERLESSIIEDINNSTGSRRIQLYTDLMNYMKPKLAYNKNSDSVEHSGEVSYNININFTDNDDKPENLSDEITDEDPEF